MLPTLLRKGFIIPPKNTSKSDQKKLENTITIDYILEFISKRVPPKKGSTPKIKPKKYGDKVIILKSDTGSGKSTILPAKLYNTFFNQSGRNILVTQPRVLTAVDIPSTIVPFEPDLELDKNIGYNTGSFKRLPQEKGIIFSTIGVLTQQLIMNTQEDFLNKYEFIIIDEVHERDIETNICLFLLKKLIENYFDDPKCPLIILTSATFNEEIFINYFDTPPENYIQVIGSTFEIEEHFTDYSISNYIEYSISKAQSLHLNNLDDIDNNETFKDIIIFVKDSGIGKKIYNELLVFNSKILTKNQDELMKYNEYLDEELEKLLKKPDIKGGNPDKNEKKYYILPILLDKKNFESGGLEYQNLFSTLETINVPLWKVTKNSTAEIIDKDEPYMFVKPTRRIIIATNVAETGITIPTLKYCIDTGYYFNVEFNPESGCNVLFPKNVTKGMAIQRRGRVGRKAPGVWYPLYTKETFDAMNKEQFSKIILTDPTENLLGILIKEKQVEIIEEQNINKIKNWDEEGLFKFSELTNPSYYYLQNLLKTNISSLDFIELPSIQTLEHSIEKLHILGYIDDNYDITTLGFYAHKIRFINLELKKMIFSGYYYGANILDLITIASFVHITKRNVFKKGFEMDNFIKKNNINFDFYNRILFADDFINCIFVWNDLQKFIQKKLSKLDLEYLNDIDNRDSTKYSNILYVEEIKKWCEDNDIIYSGLVNVISIRDQIIENMILIGLDPYKNSLNLDKNLYNLNKILINSLSEGLDEIKKIKKSIYEGFKCKVLLNIKDNYVSLLKNIKIKVKSNYINSINDLNHKIKVEQEKPKYIAVDNYQLSQKMNKAQFEYVADGFISVLDNYVVVDEKFHLR
jgi:HrpA-like RNA helicase